MIRKTILKIFISLVVLAFIGILSMYLIVTSINKVYDPKEIKVEGGQKQALIIYEPSKSNLSEEVTLKIADTMKEEGYTVTINYPSDKLNYDLNKYDVIAFGSPVYCGQVSPVLKKYIENNPIENKKVIAYTIGHDDNNKTDLENLESYISDNNVINAEKYTKNSQSTFFEFIKQAIK